MLDNKGSTFPATLIYLAYIQSANPSLVFPVAQSQCLVLAKQNHLDEALVSQFIRCMGVYPVGSLVELGSNTLAIVDTKNAKDPTKPLVRAFYDAQEQHYVEGKKIDLEKEDDFIVKGVRADDFDLDMNKIVEFLMMDG